MGLDIYAAAKKFYEGMVRCALFTGTTEHEDQHLDTAGYGEDNLTAEARSYLGKEAVTVCTIAISLDALNLEHSDFEQAGIDFWFARNGHGAGFSDRTDMYGNIAVTVLEKLAEGFGEAELYEIGKGELDLVCRLYAAGQPERKVNTPVTESHVTINDLWEELL
jgi:hypothetical protein